MADNSSAEPGRITIKLHKRPHPEFAITYFDKLELFQLFKKHVEEDLGIPVRNVMWRDDDNEIVPMDNADIVEESTSRSCLVHAAAYGGMNCSSVYKEINEEKVTDADSMSINFEICCTTRLYIDYKDKNDLFESFKKKVEELKISLKNITWNDGGELKSLENVDADALLNAAKSKDKLRLYVRDPTKNESNSERN